MKRKTQIALTFLWGLAVAGSRILYFFLRKQEAADIYEYFADAMIRTGESNMPPQSGLACAYTENLSVLLQFTGNRIDAVCVYQMILQIMWILLLFMGISLVSGKLAGIVSASVLAALPMILNSIFVVSTENFYMLHLAFMLLLLGIFFKKSRNTGWYRSIFYQLYLILSGFYLGIICMWNYVGWCLILMMIYILIQNHFVQRNDIREQKNRKERTGGKQFMGAGFQAAVLFAGMAVGMYAALVKYGGMAGQTLPERFKWWLHQFEGFPIQCQGFYGWFLTALAGAWFSGIISRMSLTALRKKKMEKVSMNVEDEKQNDYVITEDGRKIELLKNPLPLPKKHVRKEIEFDLDEIKIDHGEKDFDFEISDDDDFDF